MSEPSIRPVGPGDRSALERLWPLFQHDLSEFTGALPDARGGFRRERLDLALGDPAWRPYLFRLGEVPAGFALVRALDEEERVLSSFFLLRPVRGRGHGLAAAARVLRAHPGRWAVYYQEANRAAAAFWPRVAAEVGAPGWEADERPVPGRPDLPPDRVVRLRVRE